MLHLNPYSLKKIYKTNMLSLLVLKQGTFVKKKSSYQMNNGSILFSIFFSYINEDGFLLVSVECTTDFCKEMLNDIYFLSCNVYFFIPDTQGRMFTTANKSSRSRTSEQRIESHVSTESQILIRYSVTGI